MFLRRVVLLLIPLLLLGACAAQRAPAPASMSAAPGAATPRCTARDGIPDPRCTPGAVDASITQANVAATICKVGYGTRARASASITHAAKLERLAAYGFTSAAEDYRLHYLIAPELGGAAADAANLWPEANRPGFDAQGKEEAETQLRDRVCFGAMSLADAQHAIADDWRAVYAQYAR